MGNRKVVAVLVDDTVNEMSFFCSEALANDQEPLLFFDPCPERQWVENHLSWQFTISHWPRPRDFGLVIAWEIMQLPGVQAVGVGPHQLVVSKKPEAKWGFLRPRVLAIFRDTFQPNDRREWEDELYTGKRPFNPTKRLVLHGAM